MAANSSSIYSLPARLAFKYRDAQQLPAPVCCVDSSSTPFAVFEIRFRVTFLLSQRFFKSKILFEEIRTWANRGLIVNADIIENRLNFPLIAY